MPDITMCGGEGCPLKEKCYRFTATPDKYRQSYFATPPVEKDEEGNAHCTYFWNNKTTSEVTAEVPKHKNNSDGQKGW